MTRVFCSSFLLGTLLFGYPSCAESKARDLVLTAEAPFFHFEEQESSLRYLAQRSTVELRDQEFLSKIRGFSVQTSFGGVEVRLERDRHLFSPSYTSHLLRQDGSFFELPKKKRSSSCHFKGSVGRNKEYTAAVSMCDGVLSGCIMLNNTLYEIHHTFGSEKTTLRRKLNDQTNRNFHERDDVLPEILPKLMELPKNQKVLALAAQNTEFSGPLFIEILVVSDAARIANYKTMEELETANANIISQVNLFFNKLKVNGVSIQATLAGQVFWSSDPISSTRIASNKLQEFIDWRISKYDAFVRHDSAVLLSGINFAGSTIGLTRLNSMCDDTTQCALATEGFCVTSNNVMLGCCSRQAAAIVETVSDSILSAETVAHEIGHQLGFRHDGVDGNSCSKSKFLMGAVADSYPNPEATWSSCSIDSFSSMLDTPPTSYGYHIYQCLINNPVDLAPSTGNTKYSSRSFFFTLIAALFILQL